jgi:hypothetical protein
MSAFERKEKDGRRSGKDRRRFHDPHYRGSEKRSGLERRSGIDRRRGIYRRHDRGGPGRLCARNVTPAILLPIGKSLIRGLWQRARSVAAKL